MVDEVQSSTVESPRDTAFFSQDGSIDKMEILTVSGQKIDVKKLLIEFSYFEDVYSFVVSGYIMLRDALGLVEKLQLTGKEFLHINFGKARGNNRNNDQVYRLYAIPKRTPSGNQNAEFIQLYFCSEELFLSQQTKATRTYKGKEISYIVKDILTQRLKVPSKKIHKIENSLGVYDFNVPAISAFEAISWVSNYARPSINNLVGADMLFFETQNGFNFRSLSSLYRQPVYATYKYQPKNVETNSFKEDLTTVLDYEFIRTFNSLDDAKSGTFSNRLISLDPLNRTKKVTDFDYNKYVAQAGSLNGTSALSSSPNRLGKTQNQNYEGVLKLAVGNSEQKKKPYLQDGIDTIGQDIYIETFVPSRTAQLSLASHTVLKIRIPGDSAITAGTTINFNLMSLSNQDNKKELDKFYSGKYLVTAVRHIIQSQGVFQTVLEISKESPANPYQSVSPTNTEYRQANLE